MPPRFNAQWAHYQSRESGSANVPGNRRQSLTGGAALGGAMVDALQDVQEMIDDDQEKMEAVRSEAQSEVKGTGSVAVAERLAIAITTSPLFTGLVATAIMLNVVSMTLQVDYPEVTLQRDCGADHCLTVWDILDQIFLAFFTAELALRLFARGIKDFFCKESGEQLWNWFDFFVVSTCWLLFFLATETKGGKFVKLLRALRILRILRVLRIFKMPFLKKLNVIIAGLLKSLSVVSWIAVMLTLVMFVGAIFCTDLIGHHAEEWGSDQAEIEMYFGTMWNSWRTLFQFLTMADWSHITRLVGRVKPGMYFFFLAYVIFAAMVILSLLTGVLADHMNSVREAEDAEDASDQKKMRDAALKAEFKAFRDADKDGKHLLGRAEFRQVLEDPDIKKELEEIGVQTDVMQADDLFECFDSHASDTLTWTEFRAGMEELRNGVTPMQVFKLEVSLRRAVVASALPISPGSDFKQTFGGDIGRTKSGKAVEDKLMVADATMTLLESKLNDFEYLLSSVKVPLSAGEETMSEAETESEE